MDAADTKIVVVVRDGSGVRHERCVLGDQQPLLIGRGWNCDIILDDQQVDAAHAELRLGERGTFSLIDLGSLNGSRVRGSADNQFASGGSIQLGRSVLKVFRTDHVVLPAVMPSRWNAIRTVFERPLWAVLSVVAFFVAALLSRLSDTVEPLSAEMLISVVGLMAFVLGLWVLFWGLITKLWRNTMHVRAHLSIGACAGLCAYLLTQVGSFLGWQTQSVDVASLFVTVGEAVLLFGALALALGIATRLHRQTICWLSCVPGVLLLSSVYVLPLLGDEEVAWYPSLVTTSYPPAWQITESDSLEGFLSDIPSLYDTSRERAEIRAKELSD